MLPKVKLSFFAGQFKDKTMGLAVIANDREIFNQHSDLKNTFNVEFNVDLPATIKVITSGKLPDDTEVDSQGNIVSDKFIKITGITVGGIIIPLWMIEKKAVQFHTNNSIIFTNYLGFNGQAILDLPKDLFSMFLDMHTID